MDYIALKALLETHPTYESATNQELLDWGKNPTGAVRDRLVIEANDLYAILNPGKFSDAAGPQWWAEHINVNGGLRVTEDDHITPTALRTTFLSHLKSGNQDAITALIPETISIFEKGGFFGVRMGDIEYAKTL